MKKKKYISLSNKSINKVIAWCYDNDLVPIALMFDFACCVVGAGRGLTDINLKIPEDLTLKAYETRDAIGREILKIIKHQQKEEQHGARRRHS